MRVDVTGTAILELRKNIRVNVIPFRYNAIAAVLASLVALTPIMACAADPAVIEEQASDAVSLESTEDNTVIETAEVLAANDAKTVDDVNALVADNPTSAGVNEIMVLAFKTLTLNEVHDLPISQSVISGEVLERELGLDYEAISKRLANVTFNQNNTRGASLSIRGVGKRAFAEVQDPSVLVVQDGVSFGLTALGNFDFYDVETIEGFRGPQGTLGGKGGSSGAVYVTTKRPSFTPSTDLSITYGQRDHVIVKGATGGPLVDDLLAWRGSFIVDKGRGYYENEYDTNHTLYNKNRLSGRVQFLLTPSEDLNVRLSVDVEPRAAQLQNGLTFYHDQPVTYADGSLTDAAGITTRAKLYGIVNTNNQVTTGARSWFTARKNYSYYGNYAAGEERETVNFNENKGQTVSNKGASAEVNYTFDQHTLTSVTAWREFTFDARNDEGTPFDVSRDGGGGVFYNQYSQEFTLKSEAGKTFDYVAGVIAFKTKNDIVSKAGWGSDAGAWFASTTQYNTLERNAGVNRGAGLALLTEVLDDTLREGDTWVDTQSNAIYGQGNWHWHEQATLTAGLRIGTEDRTTTDEVELIDHGVGWALNPVEVNGIPLGGFALKKDNNLADNSSPEQRSLADSVANRYYGIPITANPGTAYNSLVNEQKAQIGAAKALRTAQIGVLVDEVESHYDDTLYTAFLSQNYKVNEQINIYAAWQYGEKSGTAFNINGVPTGVKPEKTNSFELGIKTFLFDDTLTLNADVFVMNIDDYQQATRTIDEFQTQVNRDNGVAENLATAYITSQGNVNKVKVEGLEFDAVYSGIENISIRLSGAYNDAHYVDFKNSPKPNELTYLKDAFVDQSGEALPGAAKWTFNVGAEYRRPVWDNLEFHTSFNTAYTSSYLNDDTLSSYSYIAANDRTDISIGLGAIDEVFDISLVVKNVFDDTTHEEGWVSYSPYPYRRWVGITFSGKF